MYKKIVKELIVEGNRPFDCCHASSLTLLPDGNILAAWFGGSKEGADDVAIWSSQRKNGVWSKPSVIAWEEAMPHWNPVLLTKKDGKVLLFYKVGRKISEWYTKIKCSDDNGVTWSAPEELVAGDRGGRGPVRNKILELSDGTWLAPASTESGIWKAFADISTDLGRTWVKSNDVYIEGLNYDQLSSAKSDIPVSEQSFFGRGVIQPTFWESEKDKVHMLLRSTEGHIYRSDSEDSGRNWSGAYPTDLPNNNSGIDLVKLKDGTLVLVHNPVGNNWGKRTPIVLKTSFDNGNTWGDEFVLEDEDAEFSYPAIVTDGSRIFLTYTWKRENIAFWEIEVLH